jgi:hypothetical protein
MRMVGCSTMLPPKSVTWTSRKHSYRGEFRVQRVLVARPGQDEDGGLQHHAPSKISHLDIKKVSYRRELRVQRVLVARSGQDEDGGLQHHAPAKICHLDIKKAFI